MDSENEIPKPLKFDDFVPSNPIVRPWMKPYLPDNPRARDIVVAIVGMALTVVISIGVSQFTSNEWIVVGIFAVGTAHFLGQAWYGLLVGSAKFKKAKKMERMNPKKQNTMNDAS